MKAKFEFDLPEERAEYDVYRQGPALHSAVWNLLEWIRQKRKHSEEESVSFDALARKVHEILDDEGVALD